MGKLIQFELKKIFKSKFNLILLIIAIVFQCVMLNKYVFNSEYPTLHMKDNTVLSGIDMYLYYDNFYIQHQGTVNDEYINEWKYEYYDKLDEILDKEKMIQIYGDNYKEMMIAGENGTLNKEEVQAYVDFVKERSQKLNLEYAPISFSEENPHNFHIDLYFEPEMEEYVYTLKVLYFDSNFENENNYLNILNQSKNHKIIASEANGEVEIKDLGFLECLNPPEYELISQLNMNQINWLNEKYENIPSLMDTTIGAGILNHAFGEFIINLIYFLWLIVICSNLFAYEKDKQTDALLACSKAYKKIIMVKILTMFLLSLAVFLLSIFISSISVLTSFQIKNLHLTSYGFSIIFSGLTVILYTCYELLIRQMGLIFCSFLCVAGLSAFLSCFTKNRFISAVFMMIFTVLPMFLPMFTSGNILLSLMPLIMNHTTTYFSLNHGMAGYLLPIVDLGGTIVHTATLVCLFWIIISIILMIGCYVKQRKHIVR